MISVNDLQNLALGAAPVLTALALKGLFDAVVRGYMPSLLLDTVDARVKGAVALAVFAVLIVIAVRFERSKSLN